MVDGVVYKKNIMFITFLQQIQSGRLLQAGRKKIILSGKFRLESIIIYRLIKSYFKNIMKITLASFWKESEESSQDRVQRVIQKSRLGEDTVLVRIGNS